MDTLERQFERLLAEYLLLEAAQGRMLSEPPTPFSYWEWSRMYLAVAFAKLAVWNDLIAMTT